MATIVDTIEVLVEADATGLATQLKSATKTVASFISDINEGTINWKSVFTKSLSPTLIAGVASTVALAITQALALQSELSKGASTGADSFSNLTGAVVNASSKTGTSLSDTAQAASILSKNFSDAATAQAVLTDATELSALGLGSAADLAQQFSDVLTAWGVTSAPAASSALDVINYAAKNSKLSYGDFIKTLADQGETLKGVTSIDQAANALSAFSQASGQTAQTATNTFNVIANASGTSIDAVITRYKLMATGFDDVVKDIQTGNFGKAMVDLAEDVRKNPGIAVSELSSEFGLLPKTVDSFRNTIDANFADVLTKMQQLTTGLVPIKEEFEKNESAVTKLHASWTSFLNTLGQLPPVIALVGSFATAIDGVTEAVKLMGSAFEISKGFIDSSNEAAGKLVGTLTKDTGQAIDVLSGSANQKLQKSLLSTQFTNSNTPINDTQLQTLISKAQGGGISLDDLVKDVQGSYNSQFLNTFNISTPQGGEKLTAQQIVKALYSQFQGQHQ